METTGSRLFFVSRVVSRVLFFEARRANTGKRQPHEALYLQWFDDAGKGGKKPENVVLRL